MAKNNNDACACCASPVLIFSCSGGADTGKLADQAAHEMTRQGIGRMFCLAGIGGKVSGIVASAKAASGILAIDGCGLDCAKKTLQIEGITEIEHLRLSDLGFEKGKSPVSEKGIKKVVCAGKKMLQKEEVKV
jgi:uncharacterized metal-binding protein